MTILLIVLLVLLLAGGVPAYSAGTLPVNSLLGVILLIAVIMLLVGIASPLWIHVPD